MTTERTALLKVGVVIASIGRPDELSLLLDRLSKQTLAPSVIVLSVTRDSDLPPDAAGRAKIVFGTAGLPAQRNRGVEVVVGQCDVVVFFDDDYVPSRRAIEGVAKIFTDNADVVGANGTLLADGVRYGGVSPADAARMVDEFDELPVQPAETHPAMEGLYGCNMAFRMEAIGAARFDEALPLYGWQEDIDFSALVGRRGRLIRTNTFAGVHCGVTKSRSSGLRLGYSQIANPTYLVRKGTMSFKFATSLMLRNLIANHIRCFWPEPWVDRMGRLKGNWLAIGDLALGKLRPSKILELNS